MHAVQFKFSDKTCMFKYQYFGILIKLCWNYVIYGICNYLVKIFLFYGVTLDSVILSEVIVLLSDIARFYVYICE